MEDLEDLIYLIQRFLVMNLSNFNYSIENREYILDILNSMVETSLIVQYSLTDSGPETYQMLKNTDRD